MPKCEVCGRFRWRGRRWRCQRAIPNRLDRYFRCWQCDTQTRDELAAAEAKLCDRDRALEIALSVPIGAPYSLMYRRSIETQVFAELQKRGTTLDGLKKALEAGNNVSRDLRGAYGHGWVDGKHAALDAIRVLIDADPRRQIKVYRKPKA